MISRAKELIRKKPESIGETHFDRYRRVSTQLVAEGKSNWLNRLPLDVQEPVHELISSKKVTDNFGDPHNRLVLFNRVVEQLRKSPPQTEQERVATRQLFRFFVNIRDYAGTNRSAINALTSFFPDRGTARYLVRLLRGTDIRNHNTPTRSVVEGSIISLAKMADRFPHEYLSGLQRLFSSVDPVNAEECYKTLRIGFGKIREYNKSHPQSPIPIPKSYRLYLDFLLNPHNIKPDRNVLRVRQEKTGGETVLLGGKLFQKAVIKKIKPEEFEVWKKLQEAGVPVEPLLFKQVNGKKKYRAAQKDGIVRVSAGVINGMSVGALALSNPHLYAKHRASIKLQEDEIERRCYELGVVHVHAHDGNFLVSFKKGVPKVYLIDFDGARFIGDSIFKRIMDIRFGNGK